MSELNSDYIYFYGGGRCGNKIMFLENKLKSGYDPKSWGWGILQGLMQVNLIW